jgi:hypothetical protein
MRFRVLLTLFIVFHLFAVVLAPNINTYLGTRALSIVYPYISFFEIASQWGFFAPDPGPPPVFIEWEIIGDEGESIGTGLWPEKKETFFLRERQNRRIGVTRFLIQSDERVTKTFGPYLCRKNSKARSVRLWRVWHTIANIHDIAKGKRKIGDEVDVERKFAGTAVCEARL